MLQNSFFSKSRSFTRPLFCFFVPNLDRLADSDFFWHPDLDPDFDFFRFTMYSYVNLIDHPKSPSLATANHLFVVWAGCIFLVALVDVWRNQFIWKKRQKSLFLFTAQKFERSKSGPGFQQVQIWGWGKRGGCPNKGGLPPFSEVLLAKLGTVLDR